MMDFSLNEEQQMLADLAKRFVAEEYDSNKGYALSRESVEAKSPKWKVLCDIGLTSLLIPEQYQGFGGGPVDSMIVMEAFGKGLVLEPFLSTCVMMPSLIAAYGTHDQKNELLPAIAGGTLQVAFAALEPQARYDFWHVTTRAQPAPNGLYVLNGRKTSLFREVGRISLLYRLVRPLDTERGGLTLFWSTYPARE